MREIWSFGMPQRRFERSKFELDGGDSYIVRRDDGQAPSIIIFIHGFTGDHEETWGEFPARLLAHTSMISYDYASFGYATTYIDLHDPGAIEWRHLYRLAEIYHRVYPGRQDIDALPDIGMLVEALVKGGL
jgi:pimeloyl-ACP methyl ester carboxylesterase